MRSTPRAPSLAAPLAASGLAPRRSRRLAGLAAALTLGVSALGTAMSATPATAAVDGRLVAVSGRVLVAHGDALGGEAGTATKTWLATPQGGRLRVSGVARRFAGAPVVIQGRLSGTTVSADAVERLDPPRASALGIPSRGFGAQALGAALGTTTSAGSATAAGEVSSQAYAARTVRTALLLARFPSDPAIPFSVASAQATMYGDTNSVKRYYQDATDGAITVSGDVLGWYTVDATADCSWQQWSSQAQAAATAAGVNMGQYQEVIVAGPVRDSCGFAGVGYLGVSGAYINGYMSVHVIGHEMGHNFGSHHAASYRCTSGGVNVALSGSCTMSEYGDPYSIMGTTGPGLHNAQQAAQIMQRMNGGVPSGFITTAGTGTYTLARRHSGVNPQLLRIARGATGTSFDLELRSNYGSFDAFASGSSAPNGVMIRISPTNLGSMEQSKLVDATPATTSFADAPFVAGTTLTDTANNISITVSSVGTSSATITVRSGGDVSAPSMPGNLVAIPAKSTATLSWTSSTDNVGVTGYKVYRGTTLIATVTSSPAVATGLAPNTDYTFSVRAADAAGNLSEAATASTTTLIDTQAPSGVGNLKVSRGATAVTVSWSRATDDVAVAGYRVYLDSTLVATTTTTGYSLTGLVPQSTHTVAVHALDASGNQGPTSTATFTTTADTTAPKMPQRLNVSGAQGSYTMTWAEATDDVGVVEYRVSCGATLVATPSSPSWTGVCAVRSKLSVAAVDAAGNVSRAVASSTLR